MDRTNKLEIINRREGFMDCKVNGAFYSFSRFNAIQSAPFYEPFLGWYVAEG